MQEKRNFSFDNILPKEEESKNDREGVKNTAEKEDVKEEQDTNLHSMLLCEEEIPRSPAPAPDVPSTSEVVGASSSATIHHEMPFASAPGTSNSKMLLDQPKKHQAPPRLMPLERENRADAQAVIENTPPTTPESTISNLSPRG